MNDLFGAMTIEITARFLCAPRREFSQKGMQTRQPGPPQRTFKKDPVTGQPGTVRPGPWLLAR